MRWLIIDVATAPLPDAASYLEGAKAPSNYRDPEKIAVYIAEANAERLSMAALDLDLARITGMALWAEGDDGPSIFTASVPEVEPDFIRHIANLIKSDPHRMCQIITYGGFNFDLPMLMRRARYLGVEFPALSLDRYKSPHLDLCELLSDRNPSRRRPLGFYARRLGWTDIHKTLDGAEEAQVPVTGRWEDLEASLRHDVMATHRLAQWVKAI